MARRRNRDVPLPPLPHELVASLLENAPLPRHEDERILPPPPHEGLAKFSDEVLHFLNAREKRSKVMSRAWEIADEEDLDLSEAMEKAWAQVKEEED